MAAYYNEIELYAANWLRNAIAAGVIASGEVDTRSIVDVMPDDLRPFTQCHFFAGVGLWSVALRMAAWSDDRPVWTGSCPCQPFSSAGKRKGVEDERHLWPEFYRLIAERRPSNVFGEQVASKGGREWLSGVFVDLENVGYAVAGADMCAAGFGAPHIRQRLYWTADSADADERRRRIRGPGEGFGADKFRTSSEFTGHCQSGCGVGDATGTGLEGQRRELGAGGEGGFRQSGSSVPNGFWSTAEIRQFGDGKTRRVEPSISLLAYGVPARVGKLRAVGNAIVPQVAAGFIAAYLECRP